MASGSGGEAWRVHSCREKDRGPIRSEPVVQNGEAVDGGWAVVPVRFKLKP
jgi:hypothetical protein